ncbi:hypothetical protein [Nostoc sp.]|uniref:hypothetical protein n=1 Tax=Nostoc sp. TaxID=1180 RepID=UPI002FF90967
MRIRRFAKVLAAFLAGVMLVHLLYACSPRSQAAEKTKLTITTVNNGDMVVMQGLSRKKEYIQLVAKENGWVAVPPGTRTSTYQNPNYQKAAPFAEIVLGAIQSADVTRPSAQPTPYKGVHV